MLTYIQGRLTALFDEVTSKDMKYSKTEFPAAFEKIHKRYADVFAKINKMIEESSEKEELATEIASYIPDYVESKVDMKQSKRKLETIFVDYNMKLVIFILPMFNYEYTEEGKLVSERLVSIWNERFPANIGNSGYDQINEGFKKRLCYITTAVCQSLEKPDDCYELETLRKYRDQYLLGEGNATELVQEYYDVAPTIVKRINQSVNNREIYNSIWSRYLSPCIGLIEEDKNEECKQLYTEMVRELQKTYLYS